MNPCESLKILSRQQLLKLWRERLGDEKPPAVKTLLMRELAWREQCGSGFGLDAETRSLLRSAVRLGVPKKRENATPRRTRRRSSKPLADNAGARLVRVWNGVTHEVTVTHDGKRFVYNGQIYRSLSRIATQITGAHWSGPRFFGLIQTRRSNG